MEVQEDNTNQENISEDEKSLQEIIDALVPLLKQTKSLMRVAENELLRIRKERENARTEKRCAVKRENGLCLFCGKSPIYAKGLCSACYNRKRRNGTLEYLVREKRADKKKEEQERKEKEEKKKLEEWQFEIAKEVIPGIEPYEDLNETVELLIKELTEREQKILVSRYRYGKHLKEIGEDIGVTRERVRQILRMAIRRLRIGTRKEKIEKGISQWIKDEEKKKQDAKELAETILAVEVGKRKAQEELYEAQKEIPLEELDLSVRAYNCLLRGGLKTVGDVIKFVCERKSLLSIRNLGAQTESEILGKLEKRFGLKQYYDYSGFGSTGR